MLKLYKNTGIPIGTVIYDIETPLLKWYAFSSGEQYLGAKQLVNREDYTRIMTVAWMVVGTPGIKVLNWIDYTQEEMIDIFTKVLDDAPLVIGKNNNKFDDKHINTGRLVTGGRPNPQWMDQSDDVQKQLKKHFNLQSYGLDEVCALLGMPCKIHMNFQDWVDYLKFWEMMEGMEECDTPCTRPEHLGIQYKGEKAHLKFIQYNKFDVKITWELIKRISPYVNWKFKVNAKDLTAAKVVAGRCIKCRGPCVKYGVRYNKATAKQRWKCDNCSCTFTV